MKKRIVSIILAIVLTFSVTGCTNMNGRQENDPSTVQTQGGERVSVLDNFLNGVYGKYDLDGGSVYEEMAYAPMSSMKTMEATEGEVDGSMYFYMGRSAEETEEIPWNTEEYKYMKENGWMNVKTSPYSTFAADVDTASYANVRRMLTNHETVPADAVRIEEMINYFHYDYAKPAAGEPFSVTTEMAPCPWNDESRLLMIGLAADDLDISKTPNSNLVFLIDVSGSMDGEDRLGLVQRSFKLLCEELRPGDRISIVTYASGDSIVLEGATGDEKAKICDAIEDLFAYGGTNGGAGIQSAYRLAEKYFIEGGNNRVILATDGDLNIGITDEGGLTRLIQEEAKSGVFLSVLGFGRGNISDTRMEALADNGNGNYSYIDSIAEARKVLIEEMGGTLFTVAKDVKLQVEFNPALVKGYRLIGYENRVMAAEEFADDTKDGGEIGAGHQVTALYEVALKDSKQEIPEVESRYGSGSADEATVSAGEYLTVNVRYKEPAGDTSKLLVYPVTEEKYHDQMSDNLSWAAGVAQAGMLLKQSEYAGTSELKSVLARMEKTKGANEDEYKKEFLYLYSRAQIESREVKVAPVIEGTDENVVTVTDGTDQSVDVDGAIPASQAELLLVVRHTNFAWGRQDSGYFVDTNGCVYFFDFSEGIATDESGNVLPIEDRLHKVMEEGGEPFFDQDFVNQILELGANLSADDEFEKTHTAYDMGQITMYFYNAETKELLQCQGSGDYSYEPKNESAAKIVKLFEDAIE